MGRRNAERRKVTKPGRKSRGVLKNLKQYRQFNSFKGVADMMPSLDHCISNTSEMTTLTKTLEVFDTYKHRDDKDSDEESFHLPLDDDESDTKLQDPVRNGNGNESEDEILNKFDSTSATFDPIDSKLEDRLLNDDEEENKGSKDETCLTSTGDSKSDETQVVENGYHENAENGDDINSKDSEKDQENVCEEDQIKSENSIISENEKPLSESNEKNEDIPTEKDDVIPTEKGDVVPTEKDDVVPTEKDDVPTEKDDVVPTEKVDVPTEKDDVAVDGDDAEENETNTSDAMEVDNVPKVDVEEKLSNDEKEVSAIDPLCDITKIQSEVDEPVDSSNENKALTEELSAESSRAEEDVEMKEPSVSEEPAEEKFPSNKIELDDNARHTHEDEPGDTTPLEKCDSNDSTKHNEDSEELFDISVIRDAEEDNAESAYNEAHPEESEDYDDRCDDKMEDDSTMEKTQNEEEEEEEMDIDKNEDPLKGSDDVDIEETNLKLDCDVTKDSVSDGEGENIIKTDLVQVKEQKSSDAKLGVEKSVTECRLDEVTGNLIASDGREINFEENLSDEGASIIKDEDSSSRNSLKRQLSDETETGAAKKIRTEQVADVEIKEIEKPKEKLPLRQLLSLSDFMKSRKHNKRLTMHDLEEFCVQKICEVIVHKSELGDVHHQLKQQEQLIESMRKEITQLTKQARDLEIVNKKLLNDLKQQTSTQKPLNPLKITRSVGLQVKFTPSFEANLKRRHPAGAPSQKPPAQTTPARANRVNTNAVTPPLSRQVPSPQKQPQPQQLPKPNTPLLSQALQSRRSVGVADTVNKTPTPIARPKPPEPKPSASVIDLTDEDDKKDKTKTSPTKMMAPKNITVPLRTTPMRVNATAQGIRLTTSQGKVSPITSMVNASTSQVMYVVQSSSGQNVLASSLGSKAVVVNFQSANGVLTSALNGSAVSVIPKQANTIQLKTVASTKQMQNNKTIKIQNKHPAPLPPPPVVRLTLDKPLKPIPPKPHLTIKKTETGIILQWKMPYELELYEMIASYQLYAYQETSAMPSTDMWRKVGDVKALALPMACTLTQFADKNKYYFAVRAVDIHKRIGMFSEPEEISL